MSTNESVSGSTKIPASLEKPIGYAKMKASPKKKTKPSPKSRTSSRGGSSLKSSVDQKILSAMAQLKALGVNQPPRDQVAFFSGYMKVSPGFVKTMSTMKSKGYVEYPNSKTVAMTPKGEAMAPETLHPPQSNAEVHSSIKKHLKPTAVKIFDALADGEVHTRMAVGLASGYSDDQSPGFKKALSSLKSLGLITYPSSQTVQLDPMACPFRGSGLKQGSSSDYSDVSDVEGNE